MVVKLKIMNINKRHSKLKVRYFKTPNTSYTEPLWCIKLTSHRAKMKKVNNIIEMS